MNDFISKQAAIEALDGEIEITGRTNAEAVKGYVRLVKDRLERLPSAQPEIIRCKDCKFYRQEIDMCDEPYSTAHNVVHEDDYCSRAERKDGEQP